MLRCPFQVAGGSLGWQVAGLPGSCTWTRTPEPDTWWPRPETRECYPATRHPGPPPATRNECTRAARGAAPTCDTPRGPLTRSPESAGYRL